MKWFFQILKVVLLFFMILLVFFYSFWFSFSEEKIKDFFVELLPQKDITISSIKKKWCSIEIKKIQYKNFPKINAEFYFCTPSLILLQKIPATLRFDSVGENDGKKIDPNSEIYVDIPIFAQKGFVRMNSDFKWNKIPLVSDYIQTKGNPFYDLTLEYTDKKTPDIQAQFQAKNFIIDNEKINPVFIRDFLPQNIKFDDLSITAKFVNNRIDLKITSKGFFAGNIVGIISRNNNFLQSKISFKVVGKLKKIEDLNSFIKNYLQPYLKKNLLQIKISGTLGYPKIENL